MWLIIDLNILDRSEVDFQVRWIYLHIFAVYSTLQNMLEWNWHISFTSS